MANVNFCGLEVLDSALAATGENLGEYIDTINSYMGQPVVTDQWENGSNTNAQGDVINAENASYDWTEFNPKQATTTEVQRTIFQNTIDDENFGKSEKLKLYTHTSPYTGEEEDLVDPSTKWAIATPEEVAEAMKNNTLKTVFKFEKLSQLHPESGDIVAVCKSGIYTYYKSI